jgi:predicted component of type VI protein secretion system
MIAKLIPLDGSRPISITQDVTVVGRKRGICDVCIDHSSISKLHCVLTKTDGLLFFRDLGSTNGTKVNGQRVIRGALLPGDELSIASLVYRVHLGPGEPEVGHHENTEMLSAIGSPLERDDPNFPRLSDLDGSDSDVRLLPEDSNVEPVG